MSGFLLRTAFAEEMPEILNWAAAEGWNPGLGDAKAFYATDPDGFFVAEKEGRSVAAISVVNHSDDFAFLGLYLCLPEHRGKGIAFALWKHALKHADDRVVGLDGVAAQEANYARSGFQRSGATTRYEGQLTAKASPLVRSARSEDAEAIAALDLAANGYKRDRFLSVWCAPDSSRKTLVLCDGDNLIGFITARKCREGVKLGPIIAPDAARGIVLARAAMEAVPGEKVIIDLPAQSTAFAALLVEQGFEPGFETARMYRGTAPKGGDSLQAIATMELG